MEPIGCPETSASDYHYLLRNNSEGRISHLFCIRSLKSLTVVEYFINVYGFILQLCNKFSLKDLFRTWNCGPVCLSLRTDGQTDEQTDMTKLIVAFRHFANVSGKRRIVLHTLRFRSGYSSIIDIR